MTFMDLLLWTLLVSAGAVCIWIWKSEFGVQFPSRNHRSERRQGLERRIAAIEARSLDDAA